MACIVGVSVRRRCALQRSGIPKMPRHFPRLRTLYVGLSAKISPPYLKLQYGLYTVILHYLQCGITMAVRANNFVTSDNRGKSLPTITR
jgi:hypothetical protein